MAKVQYEQARTLFWNVPAESKGGKGSFIVAQIKSKPRTVTREKADKSGTYETSEVILATNVGINGRDDLIPMTFKAQDLAIGGVINQVFPQIAGKTTDSPIGAYIGIFYHDTNDKGYWKPDFYVAKDLAEVLSDMNGENLSDMHAIQGGADPDWRFTYMAWTPTLAEYLEKNGVTDNIPF